MEFKSLISNDDAVSPVIGVILMVAITVILAAVIATFVLGLGDNLSNTAPQASFDFNPNGNSGDGSIVMAGGDQLNGNNIKVTKNGTSFINVANAGSDPKVPGSITAGTDLIADASGSPTYKSADAIRIIWTSPQGGDSAIIGSYNT